MFLFDLAMELPDNTSMNKYAIKLVGGKQSSFKPIYALSSLGLEILKIYIETHLKLGLFNLSSP